jgi:hypothetical protein
MPDDAVLFPVSFAGALTGIIGMLFAPDGATGEVAGLLFLGCSLIFAALVVWYPGGVREE